uniref:Uncharacterized protein n=1 Tax=Arundo donax TaxID=35708 RepID=A0A0A9BP43_ARUDO
MEASLSDYCRKQGKFRQGCRPTVAPVEEMIVLQLCHALLSIACGQFASMGLSPHNLAVTCV